MRIIKAQEITQVISELCIKANKRLPSDLENCISCCSRAETKPIAQGIFKNMLENIDAARGYGKSSEENS